MPRLCVSCCPAGRSLECMHELAHHAVCVKARAAHSTAEACIAPSNMVITVHGNMVHRLSLKRAALLTGTPYH